MSLVRQRSQERRFEIIDRFSVAPSWNGAALTLLPNDNANMPVTPNGSMVFAYQNMSTQNNQGNLSLTSGGGAPQFLEVPALANQPSILVGNWHANNLSVTNVSPSGADIPIRIQAIGPGLPSLVPIALPNDGTSVQLASGQAAQGPALPQYMNLVMSSSSSQLHIFALIGGPTDSSGNNAYVISVNATANTGPGTGVSPPPGYYATTMGNQYAYQLHWGSSTVFVANLSGDTADAAQVVLYPL
ncbi:Hypothetical protein A7982_01304 [Minicystis rosea]|nr:Hypothetical protein A7982_01304 [Minicystis rosea]